VKTKSSSGAPGPANSSQLLLRSPSVGRRFFCSSSMANGLTLPAGNEPAEKARKRGAPIAFIITSLMIERAELRCTGTAR